MTIPEESRKEGQISCSRSCRALQVTSSYHSEAGLDSAFPLSLLGSHFCKQSWDESEAE